MDTRMKTLSIRHRVLLCLGLMFVNLSPAYALDPPHDGPSNNIECLSCHVPHGAPGGNITQVEGNPNLCMSCHNPSGMAALKPFSAVNQAYPGQIGNSHRWDSGPSGHVDPEQTNTSPGTVRSGGAFTGRIEKTYTISISASGDSGSALFDWEDSDGNSASGVLTGTDVALADGLLLKFENGPTSPSFVANNRWTLYVRTDLRLPDPNDTFEKPMWQRLSDAKKFPDGTTDDTYSKVVCSVCHDQHSQENTPFDTDAPIFAGDGTGEGRHFQRQNNDVNQMCLTCHDARDVQSSADGSHPVRVDIPAGEFQTPPNLPLDPVNQQVACMSCHAPHYADSGGANSGQGDGYLLRESMGDLCFECHTLADRTNGSHFSTSSGVLWPGGQYGSSFPAHSPDKRGFCINCHWPHGWPDDDNVSQDYPRLWVEQYDISDNHTDPDDGEDLCYTCHDGTPAQTNIRADFLKGTNGSDIFRHPIMDSEQSAGRSVECVDCHNPHKATPDNRYAGVDGVNLDGSVTSNFTEAEQYKLCFKCHGDTYNSNRPRTSNKRLDFNTMDANSGYHPVTQIGRNQSANLNAQLRGGLTTNSTIRCTDCHNSNVTGSTAGPVVDSASLTQGPHGSTSAPILRANFNTNFTQEGWNNNNAALCFLCHDSNRLLARRFDDGARTNFYQQDGRDNLHWYHLTDKSVTASCLSCHFDLHSNRTASNTEYRWRVNGQWFTDTSPPPNVKSHLVNFAPDVQANNFGMPRWEINTETGLRRCDVSCHGRDMDGEPYQPPSGDEPSYTF